MMIGGVWTQRSRQHHISNEGVNHPYIIMDSNLNPLINQDDLDETSFNPLDFILYLHWYFAFAWYQDWSNYTNQFWMDK